MCLKTVRWQHTVNTWSNCQPQQGSICEELTSAIHLREKKERKIIPETEEIIVSLTEYRHFFVLLQFETYFSLTWRELLKNYNLHRKCTTPIVFDYFLGCLIREGKGQMSVSLYFSRHSFPYIGHLVFHSWVLVCPFLWMESFTHWQELPFVHIFLILWISAGHSLR